MLLLFALLIIASLFATRISDKIGFPVLVVFLAVGLIVGSDILGLIEFSDAKFTKQVADILLIFILFDGGFRTMRSDLKVAAKPAITQWFSEFAFIGLWITIGCFRCSSARLFHRPMPPPSS